MPTEEFDIPGYDFEEHIGKGGMANVYRARQHTFDRDVAVKILNPDLSDDGAFSQRFIQESLIVAKLHHSNIVQVYDVGEFNERFYIAMEYLHGGDLSGKLNRGISVEESVHVVKQAASALDFAHRKHIIHRDIKPDNIMFREDGAAVITDFGIAKEVESDINLTQTGLIMGTPKYMSPEQIRGKPVDGRSDVYSLGVVFYRCLAGRVPYGGKDMVQIAYAHACEPAPPLPASAAGFQSIVDKMMAKNPEERYQTCMAVVSDLNNIDWAHVRKLASNDDATVVRPRVSSTAPTVLHEDETQAMQTSVGGTTQPSAVTAENVAPKLPLQKQLRKFIAGGAASIALVFLLLVIVQNQKENVPEAKIENEVTENSGLDKNAKITISRLLDEAEKDIQEKRLKKPDANNAFSKLQRVLQLQPDNPQALSAMEQIAEEYVKMADKAISNFRYDSAEKYLGDARSASPDLKLIQTISNKLDSLKEEKASQKASILSLEQSLQVEGLLRSAEIDEEEGRLTSPAGKNARAKYLKVLELDPSNKTALEKMKKIRTQ